MTANPTSSDTEQKTRVSFSMFKDLNDSDPKFIFTNSVKIVQDKMELVSEIPLKEKQNILRVYHAEKEVFALVSCRSYDKRPVSVDITDLTVKEGTNSFFARNLLSIDGKDEYAVDYTNPVETPREWAIHHGVCKA